MGTVIVLRTAPLTVAQGSIEVATGVDIEAHHRGEAEEEGMEEVVEEGMDATSLVLKWIIVVVKIFFVLTVLSESVLMGY